MSSPDLQTVVIACPNCGTRYQVPYATIGATGREVQCAQCSRPWHAVANAPRPAAIEEDVLFSPGEESQLDAAFEAEQRKITVPVSRSPVAADPSGTITDLRSALAPRTRKGDTSSVDPALLTKSRRAFDARQARLQSATPTARLRRVARLGAFAVLVGVFVFGLAMRTELVRWYPSLAGLYSAIGLPVNVVGLTFEDSKTVTSFRNGKPLMLVTATIRSVANRTVTVPPVQVSLRNASGAAVYEWTVTPKASHMEPGEVFEFSTEVSAPPRDAVTVRLSFSPLQGAPTGALSDAGNL